MDLYWELSGGRMVPGAGAARSRGSGIEGDLERPVMYTLLQSEQNRAVDQYSLPVFVCFQDCKLKCAHYCKVA